MSSLSAILNRVYSVGAWSWPEVTKLWYPVCCLLTYLLTYLLTFFLSFFLSFFLFSRSVVYHSKLKLCKPRMRDARKQQQQQQQQHEQSSVLKTISYWQREDRRFHLCRASSPLSLILLHREVHSSNENMTAGDFKICFPPCYGVMGARGSCGSPYEIFLRR